jgi:hypothetical protein
MAGRQQAWGIEFFRRHAKDDHGQAIPGREFLDGCPPAVRQKFAAILAAVAAAPPPSFSGGGYWEAMHGEMNGYYEARVDGPKRDSDKGPGRRHYRLFCVLERVGDRVGLPGATLTVITGLDKPLRTVLSKADYAAVRALADEYYRRVPRSVA